MSPSSLRYFNRPFVVWHALFNGSTNRVIYAAIVLMPKTNKMMSPSSLRFVNRPFVVWHTLFIGSTNRVIYAAIVLMPENK